MLMIRLARFGARKQPYYRVVVIEKDRARNGRSIEVVGTYNPRTSPATVDLKRERIEHWTSNGAQLSERVAKLLAAYRRPPPRPSFLSCQVPANRGMPDHLSWRSRLVRSYDAHCETLWTQPQEKRSNARS